MYFIILGQPVYLSDRNVIFRSIASRQTENANLSDITQWRGLNKALQPEANRLKRYNEQDDNNGNHLLSNLMKQRLFWLANSGQGGCYYMALSQHRLLKEYGHLHVRYTDGHVTFCEGACRKSSDAWACLATKILICMNQKFVCIHGPRLQSSRIMRSGTLLCYSL